MTLEKRIYIIIPIIILSMCIISFICTIFNVYFKCFVIGILIGMTIIYIILIIQKDENKK